MTAMLSSMKWEKVLQLLMALWRDALATLPAPVRIIYVTWVAYSAYVFFHSRALVPDEMVFLDLARTYEYGYFISQTPPFAYGSLFWITLKFLHSPTVLRGLFWLMFCTTPYFVLRTFNDRTLKSLGLLLWLTLPLAWWGGKLLSPEIPTLFITALALHFSHKQQWFRAFGLLGLAVGLKLSALPAVLFFILNFLMSKPQNRKSSTLRLLFLLLTFVAGVLIAFPNFFLAMANLTQNAASASTSVFWIDSLQAILINQRWEWDGVFSGGVLNFSLMPVPLILLLGCVSLSNWRRAIVLGLVFSAFLVMNFFNPVHYGWYWFTLFPLILYEIGSLDLSTAKHSLKYVLALVIVINGVQQGPLILEFAHQKIEQIYTLKNQEAIRACLMKSVYELQPAIVYSKAEWGMNFTDTAQTKFIYRIDQINKESKAPFLEFLGRRFLVAEPELLDFLYSRKLPVICDSVLVLVR